MNRLREVTIRDRIKELRLTNLSVLEFIYEKSGQRINPSQFATAINKRSDLREPREKEIAALAESVVSELEAERSI